MNIYIKKLRQQKTLPVNYGLSYESTRVISDKNKFSRILLKNKNLISLLNKIVNKNSLKFNRFLKLRNSKNIDNIKKQASWKGLRLRQGLPVNGQRTHTNARTAKALVSGLSY